LVIGHSREGKIMKSRGLFPGPRSVPKRSFASAAGNSEYKHVLPDTNGYQEGMTGWKASRPGGGISGVNRLAGRPLFQDRALSGEGGLAYDASLDSILGDKGKPDKGGEPNVTPVNVSVKRRG
jgi:hypothetical protein